MTTLGHMPSKKKRKQHAHEDKAWVRADQGRRRSSVALPHRNKKKYHRPTANKERTHDD